MRSCVRIGILVALVGVVLGLVACKQASWEMADRSLGERAREIADHAAAGDTAYFSGLTPDREAIPGIVEQIARSGIATNYAEHLVVADSDSASLAYGVMGDDTRGISLRIELSLSGGDVRVDQIYSAEAAEASEIASSGAGRSISSGVVASQVGSTSVTVSIGSGPVRGYGLQAALVGYTNLSDEGTSVPLPLDVGIRIADSRNRLVFGSVGPAVHPEPVGTRYLTPGATIYGSVRFAAPAPGRYTLYGRANDEWSPPIQLVTSY